MIVEIRDYQPKVASYGVRHAEPAVVIILPVVRIERPEAMARLRRRQRTMQSIKRKMVLLRALTEAKRGD